MPPAKKIDLDKLAWTWVEAISPDQIERIHLETAYRIGLKSCKSCKRNCTNNPQCLTGLGEDKYIKSQPAEITPLETSLSELRDPTQYVGLQNLGATCYVNSLIQVWFHNEDMRRIIYKWNITEDPEESENLKVAKKNESLYNPVTAVGQLQYLFAMMQFGNKKSLDPTNLAIALGLDTTTQQDAQEFSKLLLCHIEGKLQQNTELTDMLQRLSQGKYSYVNCCETCGTEFATNSTFYELDLQLAATLKEALQTYLTEEQLTGANMYLCATCNEKKDARRFIRLDSLPETLNIQLLRFVFHRESNQKKKLNSFIQFPEELDMSEYLKSAAQTHMYNLVAVLSHKGASAHSGHYIANICNSNGEWYQFSDDKVEKMQNKRIEDGLNDGPKNVKRGRVPKGFLSSNTAYMLVYKKAEITKPNTARKGRSKKTETELNNTSSIKQMEKLSVDESMDTSEDKKKAINEEEIPNSLPRPENKLNEEGMESAQEKVSQNLDSRDLDRQKETTEERKGETPNSNSSKVEYKKLNGEAHRAMSCGERDLYEEMEFQKWEVSDTVRDLVRQENVQHELSLLAVEQEKQKEIEDQNDKRKLVIEVYNAVNDIASTSYEWLPSDWLSKWLNGQSSGGVSPIDNSVLLCPHHRLDPQKVNRAKCISTVAANMLYEKYRGGPHLDENSLCETCVQQRCKTLRFKIALEKDNKEVAELMRNMKEPTETSYIVGSASLKFWRLLAMDKFTQQMESEKMESQGHPQKETKVAESQDENSKEEDADEEEEDIINFNEDMLCEHKSLKTPDSSRKLVPLEVWVILQKYFPDAKEYPLNTPLCSICEERMETAQKTKEGDKVKAKQQKDQLTELYYGKNRNEILKCQDPEKLFYLIEKGFVESWRYFIRYAESYARAPPPGIQNAGLLCETHKGLLYHPSVVNDQFVIVTAEEWATLTQLYEVDHAIVVRKTTNGELYTEPGPCALCMLARVERERLESLKYERATIYIKCVDENDDAKPETDTAEISAKRPKMDSARPSRTRRKIKGSHELKVSSTNTLMELKVMTMQLCGACPYDQHLMLGEHELTNHDLSLASLGIYPGALLTLRTDAPIENEADVEAGVANHQSTTPEKGFKGTELVPS